jgi:hypothetical protein
MEDGAHVGEDARWHHQKHTSIAHDTTQDALHPVAESGARRMEWRSAV